MQILTPELSIPPFSEVLWCYYDTWKGPDIGINSFVDLHPVQYHHHSLVKDANSLESVSDGDFESCDEVDEAGGMQIAPIIHIVNLAEPKGDGSIVNLQEGMAFLLANGQKYSADIHYINPTDQTILINSAFNIGLVPAEEVDYWLNGFDLDAGYFELPADERTTIKFDCEIQTGVSVVSLLAHAHQYATDYKIELVTADGESEVLMDIKWNETFRWSSPSIFFKQDEIIMGEGDRIRTTCTWDNTSGGLLSFPSEMCTTSGVAIGLSEPLFCTGDIVEQEVQ